ncbi:MAG: rod shape-determining protein MreC [Deltaproteobacteria bacterium]|nr:rod shape-determining protein MreC [Deltaproteobacteria bacterium]
MSFYRRIRDAAVCVALLAIPFFFLNTSLKNPAKTNVVDRVLLQISAPIQYVATQMALGVSEIWQEYIYLVDVRDENQRLRAEIKQLQEARYKLSSAAAENRRLRKLLQLRDKLEGVLLSAQVVGKEVSPFFRVMRIRLDRGDRDRVKPGMPVLSADGLVGQIQRAWGRYSDVLLTADKTSAIDVVVQRNGARGILKGTGSSHSYACRLEYLSREDEVKIDDLIVTSGLGQRFPAAIVVGTISKLVKRDYGLYQEAEVNPIVHFSQLEEVLVMIAGSRGQGILEPGR